ncbi:hypothetical protein GKP65_03825 [Salmonella enterica]|nr:hypothetical protein [Salmonella enterica subsp. enterica serovar Enteritidis]EEF3115010.1 hypothetical protein [Salmonella enterica subsp. enterica serovar Enteritidis]
MNEIQQTFKKIAGDTNIDKNYSAKERVPGTKALLEDSESLFHSLTL